MCKEIFIVVRKPHILLNNKKKYNNNILITSRLCKRRGLTC